MSSSLRTVCRPNTVFSPFVSYRDGGVRLRSLSSWASFPNPNHNRHHRGGGGSRPSSLAGSSSSSSGFIGIRLGQRRRRCVVHASKWTAHKSPYEILEVERDAEEEEIKFSYRRLAKFYHPDVYDGRGDLAEGESAESRFIKIQAAYELLIDEEKRRQYDVENRVNPMKASEAWMEWVRNKRKAFEQRGDTAIAAWAEQQDRQLRLRARQLSRSKVDPEEERRLFAKAKKASMDNFNATIRRHTLVLRKRDLMRKKAEEEKKKEIGRLLAAEGLELDADEDV
ncbi:hypothetical protein Dimus_036394 [Dionaea muscipula]